VRIRKQWMTQEDDKTGEQFLKALQADGKFAGYDSPPRPEGLTLRAYRLFPQICRGLFKEFPYLGQAYLRDSVFPLYSPGEREFLLRAFAEIYNTVYEMEREKVREEG